MPVARGVSPQAVALQRRLASGRLLPQDRGRITLATQVRELRARGLTFAACAARLGVSAKRIQAFANGQVYDAIVGHLERVEAGGENGDGGRAHAERRARLSGLVPRALDNLRSDLEGEDARRRTRATELVLQSAGLLEPEGGLRPVIHIDKLVIQQQLAVLAEDERRARAPRFVDDAAGDGISGRLPEPAGAITPKTDGAR